jgi:glycerol kinase
METWVIWWLTGGPGKGAHVTDVTNASRTLLMDLETLSWDPDILEILDIPQQMLPRIVPSSDEAFWGLTADDGPFGEKNTRLRGTGGPAGRAGGPGLF